MMVRGHAQAVGAPLLVVGGGIGGLAAALALARTGRTVQVLEAAPRFAEIGAGIQLGPNATGVLERLGVMDAVAAESVFPRRLVLRDAVSGELLTSLDTASEFRERYGHPYVVLHRHDLLSCLLSACQSEQLITLATDKRVTEVIDLEPGAYVTCADGSRYVCDALVAADGLRSTVRSMIADDEPICSQFVAYRGTLPIDSAAQDVSLEEVVMWAGPDLHLVQYPVRRAELLNQVGVFRSDRYVPDSDEWGTPGELDERFSVTCTQVRQAARRLERGQRWAMFDRPPIDNWTRNTITLLGDAAHPMLQYLAQGGCQALEDALVLADSFERAGGDAAGAFATYQAARIPRTARVQRAARTWGEICHVDGAGALLRGALLGQRAPTDFETVDWIYGGGPMASAGPVDLVARQ